MALLPLFILAMKLYRWPSPDGPEVEIVQADVRTPGFLKRPGRFSLFSAFTFAHAKIGYALRHVCGASKMENRYLIPQRNCGRFSRPSLICKINGLAQTSPFSSLIEHLRDESLSPNLEIKVILFSQSPAGCKT